MSLSEISFNSKQTRIPATYMRGGTSKGVFFNLADLPKHMRSPCEALDRLLLRVIGSPDPYSKQIDGLGGATSSTSKTVLVGKSDKAEHDVDYLFGQVAIDKAFVDWGGNCGNLSAAVGAFAIHAGLVDQSLIPANGVALVRVWQVNTSKTIVVHVPIVDGEVAEVGEFMLDGVAFPAAEIKVDFLKPVSEDSSMFPTGNLIDQLDIPEVGCLNATLINAGIPTIFIDASSINYSGIELQSDVNANEEALRMFEAIRAQGALKMGIINELSEIAKTQHVPKVAFVSKSKSYVASSGKPIKETQIDLNVRALSMGVLHHAMMGTAAVAIASAANIPGTLVNLAAQGRTGAITFGHPSGTMKVGAKAKLVGQEWRVDVASMSRSARVIMEGWVRVPADIVENESLPNKSQG
jgi:probable AcnD-accessory protein PrpF